MGKYSDRRLRRLEEAQKASESVPYDLFGRYYDVLPHVDRVRFMQYCYGSEISFERAEYIEAVHVRGTLHFICEAKPWDDGFWRVHDREMSDGLLALDRLLSVKR